LGFFSDEKIVVGFCCGVKGKVCWIKLSFFSFCVGFVDYLNGHQLIFYQGYKVGLKPSENFMAETEPKRTAKKAAAEKGWRGRPKDAKDTESRASYYARKYMESQAANTNTRVQSEIDEITLRMIDVEQQLLAGQKANEGFRSLKEELAMLQSERKAKKGHLVFLPMKKSYRKG
jgi:hypothetical protein